MGARIGSKAALTLFALLFVVPLYAKEIPTPPVFAVVVSGVRTKVAATFALNPDCSPGGKIIVRPIKMPQNGSVEFVTEKGFTNYAKDSQQYKCNEKPAEIEKVFYTSRKGFVGKDSFVIEIFFSNGNYRKWVINTDVR
jgi:hypothetical protein